MPTPGLCRAEHRSAGQGYMLPACYRYNIAARLCCEGTAVSGFRHGKELVEVRQR